MVDQADIDWTEEDFAAKFTGEREGLTLQVQKRDDPTDQIFVFWPSDPKVGVKPIKRYVPAPHAFHRARHELRGAMTHLRCAQSGSFGPSPPCQVHGPHERG